MKNMRLFRVIFISFIAVSAAFFMSGCKQQPEAKKQPTNVIFNVKDADWARIDLYDANSDTQGFIDMETYRPLGTMAAEFWHKISSKEEEIVNHISIDCQEQKYQILDRLVYDEKGKLISQTTEASDWKIIASGSNGELLCLTLNPTGEAMIQKRDLPIIRELLLKGFKK